jgi:hypothetical protein
MSHFLFLPAVDAVVVSSSSSSSISTSRSSVCSSILILEELVNSNGSLLITGKLKDTENFHMATYCFT